MIGQKGTMSSFSERLGEDIRKVGRTCNLAEHQEARSNLLADEEVAQLDMLGATMEDGGLGKVDGAPIIAPEGGRGDRVTQLRQQIREPASLLRRKGGGVELSLARGERNRGGAGAAPADKAGPKGEGVTLRGATIGKDVSPRRVTVADER